MGGERVNPDVRQFDFMREKPKQIHVCCQRLNEQQRIPLAALNEYILQNDGVCESDLDRSYFDAGMCLFRYRSDRLLHNGALYGVELQRGDGEDNQTQYADEYPQDSLDNPADVRLGLMLYQNGFWYMFLLR